MQAVVLAGGRGTRLKPYTVDLPKPLLPVGDRPIVEILLTQLKKSGVNIVHMAVNHLASAIESVVGDGSRFGIQVKYSIEPEPLSTVGPLTLIRDLPEHFIVANGDVLTDLDFRALYDFHQSRKAILTVASHRRRDIVDYGVLDTDKEGVVTGFQEKPVLQFTVSMGVYVFDRRILSFVPDGQRYGFDTLMLELLSRKERIHTYEHGGYWLNLNRPDDYERALYDLQENPHLFE